METPGQRRTWPLAIGISSDGEWTDHRWAWRYRIRRDVLLIVVLLYMSSATFVAPTLVPSTVSTSDKLTPSSAIKDATRQYTQRIASHSEVTEIPRDPSKVQILPEARRTTRQPIAPPVILRSPDNTTARRGERTTFRCQPSGEPPLNVIWEKDSVLLSPSSTRYIIKSNFNLKLINISVSDRGMYRCRVDNPGGVTFSSLAFLDVQVEAQIREPPKDYNVTYGTMVNLTCGVTGNPTPSIAWKRNRERILDRSGQSAYYWNKQYYVFNATSSANYSCFVENEVTSSDGTKQKKYQRHQGGVRVYNIPNYCATYTGNMCHNYLQGRLVFVDADLYNPINRQEPMLNGLLTEVDNIVGKSICRNAFKSFLCHNMLPDCDNAKRGHPQPKPICREDCAVVRSELCSEDLIDLNGSKNEFLLKRLHEALGQLQCKNLTSKETTPGSCSDAQLFVMREDMITRECIEHEGQYYQGNISVTETGLPCQPWTNSYPQSRNMFLSVFPELINSSNYCRNPGGMRQQPGCFPVGTNMEWQSCGIPICGHGMTLPMLPLTGIIVARTDVEPSMKSRMFEKPIPKEPSGKRDIYIICGVSLGAVCFGIIIVACLIYRRHHYGRYSRYKYPGDFDVSKLPENPMYGKDFNTSFNPHLRYLEYPRNSIIYIVDIGEGAFGRVFKAIAPKLLPDEASTTVAVKMLKTNADRDVQEYFNREAEIISRFDHANVIKLLGVCFVGKPLCLLLEYMGQGDLQEYLHYHNGKGGVLGLPGRTQLILAYQVACGMVYLTEKRFVHRDIATRNCLVGNDNEVKISDFGLARYLGTSDHFLGHKDETIPIRWTAPEALWHYKFTTYSDVWSFGVLLWEIFSFAKQPYEDMTHEEVFLKTYQGQRLGCPENTPRGVYELIQMCCSQDLNARPSFYMVRDTLEAMQDGEMVC